MIDISKLIEGKNLTESEFIVLQYIIDNIDTVLQQGVREIAKQNYTSPSTVIRLAKKMDYKGFIDLYYQLLPMVKATKNNYQSNQSKDEFSLFEEDFYQYHTQNDIDLFIEKVLKLQQRYIFIYATGFSSIVAEYLYKKLLVLGKKAIIASGTDSIGIFENNLEDIGVLITMSKSGETKQVINRMEVAHKHQIFVISFTTSGTNRVADLSDLNFKIDTSHPLDDRNMLPNTYFPRQLMMIEFLFKHYFDQLNP